MKSPILPMVVGLSFCAAGATLLYVWLKRSDEKDNGPKRSKKPRLQDQKPAKVSHTIPNDVMPLVVGRNNANKKAIEAKTNTTITFSPKDDENSLCEISGTYENVLRAHELIKNEASRSSNITRKVKVSQSAYAKIVGKGGKTLQAICRRSMAQVNIDCEPGNDDDTVDERRLLIKGTKANVNTAIYLIEELVQKDAEEQATAATSENCERVAIPSGNEEKSKVYVSAVATIDKFWVQLVGPMSRKLDDLVDSMTEYYSIPENQELHKITDPCLGQIVTAMFKYDEKWYRAEIVGIAPNEYNPRKVVLDLYFVDYGDSQYVEPNEVFEIRTDFLTLRFQAIECFLTNVKPARTVNGTDWNKESIKRFEELTKVACSKKLTAKFVTTKQRIRGNPTRNDGSSVVSGISLYDVINGQEIDIADELICGGFAITENDSFNTSVLRLDGGNANISTLSVTTPEKASTPNKVNNNNVVKGTVVQGSNTPGVSKDKDNFTNNNGKQNGNNNGKKLSQSHNDYSNKELNDREAKREATDSLSNNHGQQNGNNTPNSLPKQSHIDFSNRSWNDIVEETERENT